MRSRPRRSLWKLPSGRNTAAFLVLGVAAASLASAAWVRADGGQPSAARRAPSPAKAADASTCSPIVTGLSSSSSPAAGGTLLTVTGQNFLVDGAPPRVRIGFADVAPETATDTQIVVTVPAQRDASDPSVTVVFPDGRSSPPAAFTYADPVVDPAPDAVVSFGGGTLLTVTGQNFRCSNPRAYLDGGAGVTAECDVVDADDTHMVVSLPDWSGSTAMLHVGVVHRDLAARNLLFDGPELTGVSPDSWPAYGGTRITLTGSNFISGGEGSRVKMLRGGRRISVPIVSQTPTEIVAIAPDLLDDVSGQSPVGVCVELAGRKSRTFQKQTDGDIANVRYASPQGGPASGGTVITIVGENFRKGGFLAGAGAELDPDKVKATRASFTLPPLPPGMTALQVVQNGRLSPPFELEIAAPPELYSVSPPVVPLEGGTILTISGSNFGVSGDGLPRAAEVRQAATPPAEGTVRWHSPEAITVVAPPGQPGPADLQISIAGVPVTLHDAFQYAPVPPPFSLPLVDGASPVLLSRLGGNVVTIFGHNFDPNGDGSAVVVWGQTAVTPISVTDTEIHFVQPPVAAEVKSNPLYVESNNQGSNPFYQGKDKVVAPTVSGGPTSRAGGNVLTISGADFTSGARVRFSCSADGASIERAALAVTPTSLLAVVPEMHEHVWDECSVVLDDDASPPVTLAITGPSISGVSTRELSPSGSVVLTITGQNFGVAPRIEIDGLAVELKEFNPAEDQLKANPRHRTGPPFVPIRVIDADGLVSDSMLVHWPGPSTPVQLKWSRTNGADVVLRVAGSNFGPGAYLTLAGSLGSDSPPIVDRTGDELVARLGASPPGTVDVSVVDPDLGSAPVGLLERLAQPLLAGVLPSSVPPAGGAVITISGSNFGATDSEVSRLVHMSGYACPLNLVESLANRLACIVPPGTGTHDLIVTIDGVDATLADAITYSSTAGVTPPAAAPRALALSAGPAPFRGSLGLTFALPTAGHWRIDLFDARGARVRRWEGDSPGAVHTLAWDGRDAAGRATRPGVYFVRLNAPAGERVVRAVKVE
jgi:hypothetical protein